MDILRHIPLESNAIKIIMSDGFVTVVSQEDADLAQYTWSPLFRDNTIYAKSSTRISNNGQQLLHRMILGRVLGQDLKPNQLVDHIDRNGLNNQRSNLRLATQSQNLANSKLNKNNKTGYKGVSRVTYKHFTKWIAKISINGKLKHLGSFRTPEAAYAAYKKAAIEQWGEFANI